MAHEGRQTAPSGDEAQGASKSRHRAETTERLDDVVTQGYTTRPEERKMAAVMRRGRRAPSAAGIQTSDENRAG